jgi:hypothetical protein
MIRSARVPFFAGKQLNLQRGTQRVALGTYEGVAAANEAVQVLQTHAASDTLTMERGLARSCRDALLRNESQPDALSHLFNYGDGSGIMRQISFVGSFPDVHVSDVVMAMLISDGDASRRNRANLLDPRLCHVGVAANVHDSGYDHRQAVCLVLMEQWRDG